MSGTTKMNTFSILSVDLDRTKIFYSYITDCAETSSTITLGVNMIYDSVNDIVYAQAHGTDESLYSFDVLAADNEDYGSFRDRFVFTSGVAGTGPYNLDNLAVYDSTDSILLVPVVNIEDGVLFVFEFDDALAYTAGVAIPFTNLAVYSAALAYMPNDAATDQIHAVVTAAGAFIYIALKADFTLVQAFKVWEFNAGGSYYVSGAFILQGDSLIFGASGLWSGSDTHDSSIIFRIESQLSDTDNSNVNDYSCVAFREVFPGEQSDLYDYDVLTVASAGTYTAGDTVLIGNGYEWAIYRDTEFMNEADGVAFKTFTYTSPYDWGFDLVPGHYDFRFPSLKQQCGAYVRQNVYTVPEFV